MKKNNKIIVAIIVLFSIYVLFIATSIAVWSLGYLEDLFIRSADIGVMLVLAGAIMFLVAFHINETRQVKEVVKSNEFNLHRSSKFYSYNYFNHLLTPALSRNKNARGYLVAFNAVKATTTTTYTLNKTADFNGYISDWIVAKFGEKINKKDFNAVYYCYYRGGFLFYMVCDEQKLNAFINELEDESYRLIIDKDFRLNIQPSFGIFEHLPGKEDTVFEMTRKAITAREVAEKNYENALFFTEEMIQDTSSDEADEIAAGLEKGEFIVYYQPKFNLVNKVFTSSEALIRWNSPTRGLLSPMRFIDTAENGGLIHKIDMYVFEQVCKDLDETRRKGRRLIPVSINFSLYEFYSPNFVDDITSIVKKYNINPSLLEIEIVEGTTAVNLFLSISILKKMKEFGLRILMDDFGVGFSNFNNLKNLPIDVIKIDKSFIDNITEDIKSREIAKFMIEFSKEIGLEVVAEGVDNQKQVDILKKFKCDTIQGFYYSKPLPRNEFEKFIATNQFEKKENVR